MTPEFRSAVPTFAAADVAATARWYAAELGFEITGSAPGTEPWFFASVQRGGAELIFLSFPGYRRPDALDQRHAGWWDAYIRCDGVRTLYERVAGKPFMKSPLRLMPYGNWEFAVRDPNGYVVAFGGSE